MKKMLMLCLALAVLLCGCADVPSPVVDVAPGEGSSPQGSPAPAMPPAPTSAAEEEGVDAFALFINAGKADSTLIGIGGSFYLIDAGEQESAPFILDALRVYGVRELEAVFLTHTHSDHIGGLEAVSKAVNIKALYRAEISKEKKNGGNKIDETAAECGLNALLLRAGDALEAPGGAKFDILGPVEENTDDDNDNSLVMRLTVNRHTLIFAGDMQFAEENSLLAAGVDFKCDILKVGNHGNPDATGPTFAQNASPRWALISTDTAVDEDSANGRVRGVLEASGAAVLTTEGESLGIYAELGAGDVSVFPAAEDMPAVLSRSSGEEVWRLVNRVNLLDESYVPGGLAEVAFFKIDGLTLKKDSIPADGEACLALSAMMKAAGREGLDGFYLVSAYRTFAQQQVLWDKKTAADPAYGEDESVPIVTAYPGASEHQTGLAFDISAVDARALSASFASTPEGEWLYRNCACYGFILRYPDGAQDITKIVFEPWHFRYVGRALAMYLAENGLVLEEVYPAT